MKISLYLIFIILGYLSGSVLYAYLIPKWFFHVDVTRQEGDQNPGTANAFAFAGVKCGVVVLLLELLKGFVPVFFAVRALDASSLLFGAVLASPVAGHAFPFWRPRGGGKAIAVSFGALLGLLPAYLPVAALAFFYLLFTLVIRLRPHFYCSVATYFCFACLCFFRLSAKGVWLGCLAIAATVIIKHILRFQGEKLAVCFLSGRKRPTQ